MVCYLFVSRVGHKQCAVVSCGNRALGGAPAWSLATSEPHKTKKIRPSRSIFFGFGEGRVDVVARLCMVVDWCIDHPEYTAKIKVIPKKDYPVLMPCEF